MDLGETVRIDVEARDNVSVATLALEIDGTAFPLDPNHGTFYTPTHGGLPQIIATATDTSGNVGTGEPDPPLRVFDPSDTDPPVVEITAPGSGSVVTYLTDIVGTVTDPNLEFYRIEYAVAGSDQWVTLHEGTTEIVDGLLGTFDPTLVQNDIYDVRVVAQDVNGQIWMESLQLSVEGNAKLGNFRLEFTDLTIPLAGIPITIGRVYDTLDASQSGDFGFGWQLATAEPRIRETVRISASEQAGAAGLFAANPFRTGTRVYLTNPAGRRIGFTFDPVPEPGLLGTMWHPRFTSDPGVFESLEVDDTPLGQNPDGTFNLYLMGFPYNPSEYTLVTKDQTRYRYGQFTGLQDITNRNDVVLTYTADGIFSSVGQSITWIRDDQGRITEIIDPAGNSILYAYDAAGDLTVVTDQVGNTTRIVYHAEPAHYLAELLNPCNCGQLDSRMEYDADGRVAAIYDALGNPITQTYDVANNTEVIADRLGNETTLVFDDRGNITQETDPLGNSTSFVYDTNDNVVSVTRRPRPYNSLHVR